MVKPSISEHSRRLAGIPPAGPPGARSSNAGTGSGPISLTSTGADILAWAGYGWTRPGGVTGYRGERLTNVQGLDILTVEALLDVLDIVPLTR